MSERLREGRGEGPLPIGDSWDIGYSSMVDDEGGGEDFGETEVAQDRKYIGSEDRARIAEKSPEERAKLEEIARKVEMGDELSEIEELALRIDRRIDAYLEAGERGLSREERWGFGEHGGFEPRYVVMIDGEIVPDLDPFDTDLPPGAMVAPNPDSQKTIDAQIQQMAEADMNGFLENSDTILSSYAKLEGLAKFFQSDTEGSIKIPENAEIMSDLLTMMSAESLKGANPLALDKAFTDAFEWASKESPVVVAGRLAGVLFEAEKFSHPDGISDFRERFPALGENFDFMARISGKALRVEALKRMKNPNTDMSQEMIRVRAGEYDAGEYAGEIAVLRNLWDRYMEKFLGEFEVDSKKIPQEVKLAYRLQFFSNGPDSSTFSEAASSIVEAAREVDEEGIGRLYEKMGICSLARYPVGYLRDLLDIVDGDKDKIEYLRENEAIFSITTGAIGDYNGAFERLARLVIDPDYRLKEADKPRTICFEFEEYNDDSRERIMEFLEETGVSPSLIFLGGHGFNGSQISLGRNRAGRFGTFRLMKPIIEKMQPDVLGQKNVVLCSCSGGHRPMMFDKPTESLADTITETDRSSGVVTYAKEKVSPERGLDDNGVYWMDDERTKGEVYKFSVEGEEVSRSIVEDGRIELHPWLRGVDHKLMKGEENG